MLKSVLYTLIIKIKVEAQVEFGYNSQYYISANRGLDIFNLLYFEGIFHGWYMSVGFC